MIPIGTLGGRPPRRSTSPRIIVLAALTVVTLALLFWTSRDDQPTSDRASEPTAGRDRGDPTTTTARSTTVTTVYQFPLNEAWLPKGSSRYSESEESKAQADQILESATTTTTMAVGTGRASTTTARSVTTTTRRLQPVGTAPPATNPPPAATVPPTTVPEPPTTAPPTTAAPATPAADPLASATS